MPLVLVCTRGQSALAPAVRRRTPIHIPDPMARVKGRRKRVLPRTRRSDVVRTFAAESVGLEPILVAGNRPSAVRPLRAQNPAPRLLEAICASKAAAPTRFKLANTARMSRVKFGKAAFFERLVASAHASRSSALRFEHETAIRPLAALRPKKLRTRQ